jgi:leucyl-tRNA synthetase
MEHADGLTDRAWPPWNDELLIQEDVQVVVQINGKVRAQLNMPAGSSQVVVLEAALGDARVQRHTLGKPPRKVVYVPDRLLSLVV